MYLLAAIPFFLIVTALPEYDISAESSAETYPSEINIANTQNGTCECLAFDTLHPEEGATPIIVQKPFNVTCDPTGQNRCLQLCTALAIAAKEHSGNLLCSFVKDAHNLQASVFSNICDSKKYVYTGLTSEEQLCCSEGKEVPCKE